jgi:hypothetical protein
MEADLAKERAVELREDAQQRQRSAAVHRAQTDAQLSRGVDRDGQDEPA